MADFETHFPWLRLQEPDTIDQELYENNNIIGDLQCLQGEGTCGPSSPTCMMFPHLPLKSMFNFVTCCMCSPSGSLGKPEERKWRKNSDIIKETSRCPEEIYRADEETSITGEEAIGDGEEPKGQVDT
jgi:hypothetical protein